MKFFLVFIFFLIVFRIVSQEILPPSRVLDLQRLELLENQYEQGILDSRQILTLLDQELNEFYKQFLQQRNLREELISIPYDYFNFPIDKIHQLIYVRNLQEVQKQKKFYSPSLFRAHTLKGRILEDQKLINQALSSYLQGLYFILPILEDESSQSQKSLTQKTIEVKDLEAFTKNKELLSFLNYLDYIQMTFGDSFYLEELPNSDEKKLIQNIVNDTAVLKKNLKDIEQIKKDFYLADFQRNIDLKNNKQLEFNQKRNELFNQYQNLLRLKDQFKTTILKAKKRQYSNIVFRMANLMKQIEENQKNRERFLNQSSFYRGRGNDLGINKTLLRDFAGYKSLIEIAHQLDPENLEYLDLLSQQYFQDREVEKGLYIEKKWFRIAPENDLRNPRHYLRMISHYSQTKNYSLANFYLEKLYQILQTNSELQNNVFLENSNFVLSPYEHFLFYYADFRLQNFFIKEKEIFKKLLDSLKRKKESQPALAFHSELLRLEYLTLRNLAKIEREEKNNKEELNYLLQIQNFYNQIESNLKQLKEGVENLKKRSLEIKKALTITDNTDLTLELYDLQKVQIPNLENQLKILYSVKNLMAIGSHLERIAYLYYINREFSKSLDFYQLLLNSDSILPTQKERAQKNLKILQTYLQNGFIKKIDIPDDFER